MTEHHPPQCSGHASTTRTGGRLLAFCLATALLSIGACSNGSAPKTKEGSGETSASTLQAPAGISTVPVMLPFPVDKAGHELTTEFWVPPPEKGQRNRGFYVGLRMLFTAGDPDGRISLVDNKPIQVKVHLRHIDGDKEVPVVLRVGEWIQTGPSPMDRHIVARELSDGVATSEGTHSGHSALAPGTPNGMYYQMFLGVPAQRPPGQYRLTARVLHDQPSLQGVPMFLTVRETESAK